MKGIKITLQPLRKFDLPVPIARCNAVHKTPVVGSYMVGRRGGQAARGDVRRGMAWPLAATFFAVSTWLIVTAFYNYYYTLNVGQYVANFLSRLVGQDLALNYTCSTSPCRIELGHGDKVLNLTVDNPTASPLVLLLKEDGVKATVALHGSVKLEIQFEKPLLVWPVPTNALTAVSPSEIRTNETVATAIRVYQIVVVDSLLAGISALASISVSSALAAYLSRKPLAKMYHGIGHNRNVLIYITAAAFITSAYTVAYLINLKGLPAVVQLFLFFMVKFSYPLILITFKRGVAASSLKPQEKITLLNASDIFWILWIIHWALDPLTAILATHWELSQSALATLYATALLLIIYAFPILYFVFPRLFRLRMLLFLIPFALNYELAAREEFCRLARSRLVAVALEAEGRVYRGVVAACDGDVIAVDGGEGEYVVPWSKVDHVLEAREVADLGRGEAKALLKSVEKGSVVVLYKGGAAPYLYIYAEGSDCEIAFEGRLPVAGREAVGRGSAVVKCGGEEIRLDAAPGDAAEGTAHYKCPTRFKAAVVALGPTRVEPKGCQPAEVQPYTVENI